jgi:hypothetical protein
LHVNCSILFQVWLFSEIGGPFSQPSLLHFLGSTALPPPSFRFSFLSAIVHSLHKHWVPAIGQPHAGHQSDIIGDFFLLLKCILV